LPLDWPRGPRKRRGGRRRQPPSALHSPRLLSHHQYRPPPLTSPLKTSTPNPPLHNHCRQFRDDSKRERGWRSSFFNWLYFSINIGSLVATLVVVPVQENKG